MTITNSLFITSLKDDMSTLKCSWFDVILTHEIMKKESEKFNCSLTFRCVSQQTEHYIRNQKNDKGDSIEFIIAVTLGGVEFELDLELDVNEIMYSMLEHMI